MTIYGRTGICTKVKGRVVLAPGVVWFIINLFFFRSIGKIIFIDRKNYFYRSEKYFYRSEKLFHLIDRENCFRRPKDSIFCKNTNTRGK